MNTSLAAIPSTDTHLYSALPEPVKQEAAFWAAIVSEIDRARERNRTIEEIARRYDGSRSVSVANVRRKYYAYRRHGWKALVNRRKLTKHAAAKLDACGGPIGQPAAFAEYWKALQEDFQRKSRPAYRELLRRYRAGEQIPGIGTWRTVWAEKYGGHAPDHTPIDIPLPQGWSERNLARIRPTKYELTATRQGRSAAAKYRPLVVTTRAGMAPGQIYVFDDVWHDNKVNWLGVNKTAMRPLEFSCLDLFSGCQIAWGAQPMTVNEATQKREVLRETEMRFLLCHVLCVIGYHPSGCALHVEHGTAAIRDDLADALFNWTGGAVTVARGGLEGAATHDGFFRGRSKGNSRFKAALESHHNLKHNELAALPGQVGKDRDHAPEELHGRDRYNNTLIKAMSRLPADRAQLLRLPYLEFNQWKQIVGQVYERINARTDHQLEGWEAAGLVVSEYSLGEGSAWQPMTRLLEMPPDQRAAAEKLIDQPGRVRMRRLSPAEVWAAGRPDLVRLDPHYVPLILGHRNAKMLRVQDNHSFTFRDRRLGPGEHVYYAQAETAEGQTIMLEPGRTYSVYATPFDTSAVFVATERNEFIGIARRLQAACKTDVEAVHRQIGKAAARENELLEPVRARHVNDAREKQQMHEHNARVLEGEPVTEAEIESRRRVLAEQGDLDEIYDFDRGAGEETPEDAPEDWSDLDAIYGPQQNREDP